MGKLVVPFVRSAYNYDRDAASNESATGDWDESKTKQSFAEECDINTIVRRFHLTGELPTNVRMPTYQDFVGVFDFHSAMNAIVQASEAFDEMPAEVRARFHNEPAEFVAFCSDEANRPEAERLGLVKPKPPSPAASVVNTPAAVAAATAVPAGSSGASAPGGTVST